MEKITSTNPSRNYEVIGEVQVSTLDEIKSKVLAAREVQSEWWGIGLDARISYLEKLAKIFKENREKLITKPTEEMGAPLDLTTALADAAEGTFKWNLENAHKALDPQTLFEDDKEINEIVYEPFGVMACIVAWNFPYPNFIVSVIQPLLAGNTVIMKYSEEVPMFSKFLESLVEQANLPEGVISFVYGDGQIGDELTDQDIDIISFTGSYAVGQKLYKKAAEKFIPIVNELGGSSPGVVFDDCNVDEIIKDIFWARFANTAQFCDGLKRLIVHETLFDEVVEKLSTYTQNITIGDSSDKNTELGPLIAERQVEKLEIQLKDAIDNGAKVICGGKRPEGLKGAYFEPTLLTNITKDMLVWDDEVFGPVLPIISFKTYEEAIELANDTIYGLSGYVFTNDKDLAAKATKDIKAGLVTTHGTNGHRPQNPFGGYKKSGIGRTHGISGFHGCTQIKTVARRK